MLLKYVVGSLSAVSCSLNAALSSLYMADGRAEFDERETSVEAR